MKFETTAKILSSALTTFGRVIERHNTIPVLGTVLFDGHTLRGTDLDMELSIRVPATVASGKTCIAHRPLANLVRHISADDTVTIETGKDSATISFSGGCYDLPCLPASDFPDMDTGEGRPLPLDGEAFKKALAFTSPFISTEETRYYLNGVCIDAKEAVATDGHRLGCHPLRFDGAPFEKCIVPRKAIGILGRLPAPIAISMATKKPGMEIGLGGATLRTKLIDGTFPDWSRVVPRQEPASKLTFDRVKLQRIIARMAIAATDGVRGSTLAWDEQHLAITGKNGDGITAREYVGDAIVAGQSGLISFNTRYIADMLRAFGKSETVSLSVVDGGTPSLWRADDKAYGVLMPLRGADDDLATETLQQWAAAGEVGRAA